MDEFDRSHIAGAVSFAERSPMLARLLQEREDLEQTANPALKQLLVGGLDHFSFSHIFGIDPN